MEKSNMTLRTFFLGLENGIIDRVVEGEMIKAVSEFSV